MTMLTPAYRLLLGTHLVDTTREPRASTLVEMTVSLDLDAPVDAATLVLGQVGSFRPARGDAATIGLGYAGQGETVETVLAGTIDRVEPGLVTNRVTIIGAAAPLLATFVDETFEGRTAGAIAKELAQRAGVTAVEAEDGISFPAYVVDGRRSAAHHVHDLAELSGMDVWAEPGGKLVVRAWNGGRIAHVLRHGRDLLEVEVRRVPPRAGRVEAWGESPTGSQGSDTWGWLTPDFRGSRGTAGTGSLLLLERPALRTRAAARTAAESALFTVRNRALAGRLTIVGRATVRLGDALRLEQMPDESLNRRWQVRSVTHRITKLGGFTTEIGFRADD